ncbi:ABC transporter ATP-binding protein [Brachybacterium sp. UMB0905]|uniref:ATP-binding cassette domain-containing protein n=1 Tax=Brachybacterium sp. UMB0905 TaxID=2069310 RepID=UPI0011AFBDAD|nr:ABC transporter ATP-binding protein [Brachybacterium sp. UMB0905]
MSPFGLSFWVMAWSLRVTPLTLLCCAAIEVVVALLPAMQAIAFGSLVDCLNRECAGSDLIGNLAATAGIVGLAQALSSVGASVRMILNSDLEYGAKRELARAAAWRTAGDVQDPGSGRRLQEAKNAIPLLAMMPQSVMTVAGAVITAVSLCLAIWHYNWGAALFVVLALFPSIVAFMKVSKIARPVWSVVGEDERIAEYHFDQLRYEATGVELAMLGTSTRVAEHAGLRWESVGDVLRRLRLRSVGVELPAGVVTALCLLLALAMLTVSGSGSAGASVGVLAIVSGIASTSNAGNAAGRVLAANTRVAGYRLFTEEQREPKTQRIVRDIGSVEVRDLEVTYPGATKPALDRVSVKVEAGEMIGIVGANGAGKTTLVSAICGLVQAQSGSVLIDGVDQAVRSETERFAMIGTLSQEFGRFQLSVRDSVLLGTPEQDVPDTRIWEALEFVGIADLVREMSGGLDAQLGVQWGGRGLSGGQWQRLALARIVVRDAGIWILDEPTSAIDAEAEEEIFSLLTRSKKERITCVVSHRAWTLKQVDRIYVLHEGRLVQEGHYDDLVTSPGRFKELFRQQFA